MFFIVFVPISGEKLYTFTDLVNPRMFLIDNRYFYVTDRNSLFIYELKTFQLIKKLGSRGEGPKEFKITPYVILTPKKIFLHENEKILTYSKGFKFIKEERPRISAEWFFDIEDAVEDNFLIINNKRIKDKIYRTFNLYDQRFKKISELLRETESKDEGIYLLGPRTRLRCFKDMVFIAQPGKGFYLEIFNQQAKKLRVINKKIAQIKSKPKHRKRFLDAVIDALGQRRINRLKRLTKFHLKPIPGYLPVIKNFWVADNKIYIKTNDITDEKDKYFILDLKGKILKTVWLPKAYLRRSIFFNNCYYYLVDTDEGWQLYCKKV